MPSAATRVAAETLRLLPQKGISRALGRVAGIRGRPRLLRSAIDLYVRFYGVDLSEVDEPEGGYPSFDAFFTRPLRPGTRPIEGGEGTLVSPADGTLVAAGEIEDDTAIEVKGRRYDLGELLASSTDAARLRGASYAVIYLSPADYHRVHAPVAGPVESVRLLAGTLFPVNTIGTTAAPRVLAQNERVVVFQRSADLGEVVTVLIGALAVGQIELPFAPGLRTNRPDAVTPRTRAYPAAARPELARGAELGVFHVGSTVVVLSRAPTLRFLATPGQATRVGRALARLS